MLFPLSGTQTGEDGKKECVAVPWVFSYTFSGVELITLISRSFTVDEKTQANTSQCDSTSFFTHYKWCSLRLYMTVTL